MVQPEELIVFDIIPDVLLLPRRGGVVVVVVFGAFFCRPAAAAVGAPPVKAAFFPFIHFESPPPSDSSIRAKNVAWTAPTHTDSDEKTTQMRGPR